MCAETQHIASEKHTHTHTHSYGVIIKVVNSASYSIFQCGPASRLQSITKYITEHFPLEKRGRAKEGQRTFCISIHPLLLHVVLYTDNNAFTPALL